MTGGRVVVLGPTGRNFAAGMSGGVAYVYDPKKTFKQNCNPDMVDLDPVVDEDDILTLKNLIQNHFDYTQSTSAQKILANFNKEVASFVKVMPRDYKTALIEIRKKMKELGISEREAMYG